VNSTGALESGSNFPALTPGVALCCKAVRVTGVELQEIPQLIIIYEIWLQPTSRRFLRELDKAPGGNSLHYILQCLRVPALVTRV